MYNTASSNGLDLIHNARIIDAPFTIFYFIISVIIGNFFIMNLFVGFIIAPYNREKELAGKHFILTEKQ